MNIAYRFRIYPNREQEVLLAKTFGCCRFLYNQMLNDKIREYEATKKMLRNTPAMYKKAYPFLKEVDSLALANVQMHLEKAYKNFFRNPKIGFPKFKSKHRSRKSYTTNVVNGNIQVEDHRIKLPKLKWIRMKKHREIAEKYCLKSVTISMEPSGKYYASLLYEKSDCENQAEEFDYEDAKILGIDYAMHGMAVFSEDIQKENEGYFRKSEERLAREQSKLSHCVKGSNNYYRQKKRVALCHEKIRNQRKDFLHKLSYEMAEAYEAWCKKKDDVGEEIADVMIYLLGLSEILNIDIETELLKKINKNNEKAKKILSLLKMRPLKDDFKKLTFTKVVN